MSSDYKESEFNVDIKGEICYIKGHLVDSTNLSSFKDALSECSEVDMSGLVSVSWLGIEMFCEFLERIAKPGVLLCEVPPHVYRILLLLPQILNQNFKITTIMLEVITVTGEKQFISISLNTMLHIGEQQGRFVTWENKGRVCGSLHHLCRPLLKDPSLPKNNFVSPWCYKNEGLCLFFYEYACFMRVMLEICSLAQESTSLLIESSLKSICTKISNLEFAYKGLDSEFHESRAHLLMSTAPHIHDVSKSVVITIDLSSKTFEAVSRTFESIFLSTFGNAGKSLFEQMDYFLMFTDQISPISKNLEDVGVELGEHILRYGDYSHLRKLFDKYDGQQLDEKTISSVRRKLKVDQNIHLTWGETLKDVHAEFKGIQNELGRCIMALQGFDLVRQVLEHRIDEIEIFKDLLTKVKASEIIWTVLRDQVIKKISEKLVTNQEKYAFSFFFPNAKVGQKQESSLIPGELLEF